MIDENDNLTADIFSVGTCLACGKNNENNNLVTDDNENKLCLTCYQLKERKDDDLQIAMGLISKLIYKRINRADLTILHHLMLYNCKQNSDIKFTINQTEIATKRNLKQPNVSRSIRNLKKAGILIFHELENVYSIVY
jgi:hypothetical protein